jgi:N-acyl homoserine lactone hydrolase
MATALRIWPLLTGTQHYEKSVSTRGRGDGEFIKAPILAYLIETPNGRILYDAGCDYGKIANPELRKQYLDPMRPRFEPPVMTEEQRIPRYLARLGLTLADVDLVFLGHLHFDHAGGVVDLPGCEVHVQSAELAAARSGTDRGVFADELSNSDAWQVREGEYTVTAGVFAVESPGHTAGHMSLFVELPKGPPVILCGDAADLMENIADEVAPGFCWQGRFDQAVQSVRKLKRFAAAEKARLWPNHDLPFFEALPRFPDWID